MAKKFNLGDYIEKTESKLDTHAPLQNIELHLIDAAAGNFYSMPGIDELADNIATVGLLDPLWVRPSPFSAGRYVLISGHRRRAALRKLADRGELDPHAPIPCFVDTAPNVESVAGEDNRIAARAALQQLKLIYANSDNRAKSPADTTREVRELTLIFGELKRLGYEFPGKLREHVAAAAHISESRAARLAVIDKNLTAPKLREAFEAGRLSESSAYEIARRGADVIGRADELPTGMICGLTVDRLGAVLDGLEKQIAGDKAAAQACNDGVKAMEPKMSKMDTDLNDYLREREAEDLRYLDMMGAKLDELINDGFSGIIHSRREGIDMLKKHLRPMYTGGGAVNFAGYGNGLELRRFNGGNILRSWTEAYDVLCCAALNRLGKRIEETEDKKSPTGCAGAPFSQGGQEPQWMTGEPPRIGRYFCQVDMGTGGIHEQRCWWGDDGWSCYGSNLKANGWDVVGWWPLPKEE